jgi:hypothetical protein
VADAPSDATTRAVQAAVAVDVASEIRDGFKRVAPGDVQAAMPSLIALVAQVTRKYGAALSTHAVRDYAAARAAAGVRGGFRPVPAEPAPLPQVSAMTGWATRDLRVVTPPNAPVPPSEEVIQAAERDLVAGAERLVLNQARLTTVENVQRDREARGWAREVRPECCYFCALMASRGAVYKSADTAGRDANQRFTGSGRFKFHNNCHCTAVPVFGTYELSDTAKAAAAAYKNRGKGDPMNAYRKIWEAR